jgi:hypothetical protein
MLLLPLALTGCRASPNPQNPTSQTHNLKPPAHAKPTFPVQYTDVTKEAGITFKNEHGSSLPLTIVETTGGGCGFFDYNNDGWLDVYLVSEASENRLLRNNRNGTFSDVTKEAGVGDAGRYHMGCCAADFNNDGNVDLYLTNYGRNTLLRNNGDGTFSDVTNPAGVGDKRWSVGCAFLDYDRDGFLDFYVANYLVFAKGQRLCKVEGVDMNCPPFLYPPEPHTFYRNNGNGTFTDATQKAGIAGHKGHGLGVICFDYNNDGLTDILVANDGDANFLFRNLGSGKFAEAGLTAGVAYSQDGRAGSSMGMDFADCDFDGHLDFVVTNFQHEVYPYYRNLGNGLFAEETDKVGLAEPTLPYLGWGTGFVDFDNDGDKDVFFANGHVRDNVSRIDKATSFAQRQQLFENRSGVFVEVSHNAGAFFHRQIVGRGTTFGDYDNDGDVDVLINNLGGSPVLLRNDGGNKKNWLTIELKTRNRSAVGARVIVTANGKRQTDEVRAGGSYASFNGPRLHFGLGQATKADVEIRWLKGQIETIKDVPANHWLVVTAGKGAERRTMPLPSTTVKN